VRPSKLGRVAAVCGTNGQNARRPKISSSAGSSVSIDSAAQNTPRAPSGPRPEVPFTRAIERQNSAAITVAALAKMAGPAEISALRIATYLSTSRCISSRYLATISSA
jgi:hypothetical protein